jgi:hypothetical protein
MPKKMKITSNKVDPDNQGVALYEPVELTAEEDCIVLLGLGLGVKLKKNDTCSLAVTTDGHHSFQVMYLRDLLCEPEALVMEERIGVAEAEAGGGVALMSGTTTLLNAALAAGPTGDIHVP